MLKQMPIFDAKFWKILKYLDSINEVRTFSELKSDTDLPNLKDKDLVEVIDFLQKFNYDVHLIVQKDEVYIHPFEDKSGVQISLSFSEWIALQTHFPLFHKYSDYEMNKDLMLKLDSVMNQHSNYDLYNVSEQDKTKEAVVIQFHADKKSQIKSIEAAVSNKSLIIVKLNSGNNVSVFPHKLVYLEQQLSLICENSNTKKLDSISIDEITSLEIEIKHDFIANFSSMEIDDFIYAIRAVNGDEERLILKVISEENIDLTPPFQFMGTPYKTSNLNGDVIWAASIEVSEPLMEWLYQVKNNIEILDPNYLKEKFKSYCQKRDHAEKYRKVS